MAGYLVGSDGRRESGYEGGLHGCLSVNLARADISRIRNRGLVRGSWREMGATTTQKPGNGLWKMDCCSPYNSYTLHANYRFEYPARIRMTRRIGDEAS